MKSKNNCVVLITIIIILFLTGCHSNDVDKFQIGNLELKAGWGYTTVKGNIRNVSNDDCNNMKILLEFKDGDISILEPVYSTYHDLKVDEIYTFTYYNFNKSYEGYTATVKTVYCDND